MRIHPLTPLHIRDILIISPLYMLEGISYCEVYEILSLDSNDANLDSGTIIAC